MESPDRDQEFDDAAVDEPVHLPDHSLRRRLLRHGMRPMELAPIEHLLKPLYDPWYRECIECGAPLDRPGELHYVERALRSGEPIFEYALCESCVFRFQDDLSTESTERITVYWMQNFDLEARESCVAGTDDAQGLVDSCVFTGKKRDEIEEYQIWAWVQDGQLAVDGYSPALVSSAVIEDLQELLSKKTRDRFDNFIRDRLGLPPELQKLPIFL